VPLTLKRGHKPPPLGLAGLLNLLKLLNYRRSADPGGEGRRLLLAASGSAPPGSGYRSFKASLAVARNSLIVSFRAVCFRRLRLLSGASAFDP
jgi:hypothetical protein